MLYERADQRRKDVRPAGTVFTASAFVEGKKEQAIPAWLEVAGSE